MSCDDPKSITELNMGLLSMQVAAMRSLEMLLDLLQERNRELAKQLAAKDAEIAALKKEIAFRDFAKERESNIAINYGSYSEVQNALSSEISLHQAWRKRAEEAEQENTSLREQVSRLEWKPITADSLPKVGDEVLKPSGYVNTVTAPDVKWGGFGLWLQNGWTHSRAINAPDAARMEGK